MVITIDLLNLFVVRKLASVPRSGNILLLLSAYNVEIMLIKLLTSSHITTQETYSLLFAFTDHRELQFELISVSIVQIRQPMR